MSASVCANNFSMHLNLFYTSDFLKNLYILLMQFMHIKKLVFLTILLASPLSRAEVTETVNYTLYPVKLENGSSLLKAINAASPIHEGDKTYHGFTKWNVNWKYKFDSENSGFCKLKSVTVSLTAMITLPELNSNDETAIAQFKNYLPALKQHELGHLLIGQEAARKIEQSLQQQAGMPDCGQLKTALNARGQALISEANSQDKEYDAKTQHGKSQGAYLRNQ